MTSLNNENYFPDIEDGKIDTTKFLKATEEVTEFIENIGKVFLPFSKEMKNGMKKFKAVYLENVQENKYLHDLVLAERDRKSIIATQELMWLRRTLFLILRLLEQFVEDNLSHKRTEDLSKFLKQAYIESLEPFHSWMHQKLVRGSCHFMPNRTQFLKQISGVTNDLNEEEQFVAMKEWNQRLRICVMNLTDFYHKNKLETTDRV